MEENKVIVKFNKPFTYEGVTYEELEMDFESLTGADLVSIEREMNMENEFALTPEISPNFCGRIAAKAAGVNHVIIFALPLKEFTKVKNAARDFLAVMG